MKTWPVRANVCQVNATQRANAGPGAARAATGPARASRGVSGKTRSLG